VQAVSDALVSSAVSAETKKMIDEIYAFYTGESTSATLDVSSFGKTNSRIDVENRSHFLALLKLLMKKSNQSR